MQSSRRVISNLYIDPTDLDSINARKERHAKYLDMLLQQDIINKEIDKDTYNYLSARGEYDLILPESDKDHNQQTCNIIKITLTNSIYYAPKIIPLTKNIKHQFIVMGNHELGRGGMGVVNDQAGILKYDLNGELHFKASTENNHDRVVKSPIGDSRLANIPADNHEADITLLMPDAHAKKIKTAYRDADTLNYKNKVLLSMRRFKGLPLNKFITSSTSPSDRLTISINFLRALQQIHDKNIIHRDIKTENILVNPVTLEVRIIDYGCSKMIGVDKDVNCGSPFAMPLEVIHFKGQPTQINADLYSGSITLAEIWGHDIKNGMFIIIKNKKFYEHDFTKAKQLNILADNQQNKLVWDCIDKMNNLDQNKRGTIQEALHSLNQARLNMHLNSVESCKDKLNIIQANSIALNLNAKLNLISQFPETALGKIEIELMTAINKLDTSEHAVRIFTEILNIEAFKKITDKNALIEKARKILDGFRDNSSQLIAKLDYTSSQLNRFDYNNNNYLDARNNLHDLYQTIHGHLSRASNRYYLQDGKIKRAEIPMTVDRLVELNCSYERNIKLLDKQIASVNQLVSFVAEDKVSAYVTINQRLLNTEDNTDPLIQLKNRIKSGIKYYIASTLDENNIKIKDRAASERRIKDINRILDTLENRKFGNMPQLTQQLKKDLSKIQKGNIPLFGFFANSMLIDSVRAAMANDKRNFPITL